MAETKQTGEKKHITGARIAKEIRQYKKDALLSPMYTTLCVVLEILIPYLSTWYCKIEISSRANWRKIFGYI